jgi:hypothetical protein
VAKIDRFARNPRAWNSIGIKAPGSNSGSCLTLVNLQAGLNQHLEPVTQMFWMRQGLDLAPCGA